MDSKRNDEALIIDYTSHLTGHAPREIRTHHAVSEFNIFKSTFGWFAALVIIAGLITGAITQSTAAHRAAKPLAAIVAPGHPWTLYSPPTGHAGPPLLAQEPGPDASFALVALIKPKPIIQQAPVTHSTSPAVPAQAVPHASGSIQIVIAYALRQLGKRYVFGASGPNTFDCSGLVLAAYAQIGIRMYHYTGAMLGYGTRVSRAAMQPGDLIFPTSGHVGIYLGNNKAVFAPHSGSVVQIETVYSFYTARHITTG